MPGSRGIQVHGHRGARAIRPENTILGFQYAIEAGVDALEMDLAVTKDNAIVISHDPVLQTRELIHELTLAQVRARTNIPTLDEVLSLSTQGSFDYNLETKSFAAKPQYTPPPEEFAGLVMEKVRKHGLEKRVTLLSFDFRILLAAATMAPEIRRSALTHFDLRAFEKIAQEGGLAQIVSPHYRLVTKKKVRAAHAAGIQVAAWTVNKPAGWDKMIAADVDAIVCDDPAELIAYLKAKDLR
jgi:glycerophosphoryl diester phosphodiesterase